MDPDRARSEVLTFDDYFRTFPQDVQATLRKFRTTIANVCPEAQETIGYGMPTFRFHGNLVHFAAYKRHFGFYPAPSAIERFKDRLSEYVTSKGAIQFPIEREVPWTLVEDIVRFRVAENLERASRKKKS